MLHSRTREDLRLPADRDGWVRLWRAHAPGRRAVHHHDELEVNLVLSGRATYLIDERRYDLARGSSLWLFPHQDHVLIEESQDHTMWIAVFSPRMLRRICTAGPYVELVGNLPVSRSAKMLDDEDLLRLAGLCDQIAQAHTDPPLSNAGLAHLALSAWDAHRRADEIASRSDVHPAVERVARLLRDEREPLPMNQIARRAALSESHLSRLFKRQTGVTLVRYRLLQRLERFRQIFAAGRRHNLGQAALAAGFGSYAHFHRAFKQVYGFSPREYRRRLRDAR